MSSLPETFTSGDLVIPGTFFNVQSEGLIRAGGISSGNIGIVGTIKVGNAVGSAKTGLDLTKTYMFSDYQSAKDLFGISDALATGSANLTRCIQLLFANGARTVYARALDKDKTPTTTDFKTAMAEIIKDDVNILVLPELSTANAKTVLNEIVGTALTGNRETIAVIGCDGADVTAIKGQVTSLDRLIFVAPGIIGNDSFDSDKLVTFGANYTAAAVAGLLSSLTPQTSPTNKVFLGIDTLAKRFSYAETKDLLGAGVLVLESRQGIRVVRGITSDNGAFLQITTRRITDYVKSGIRKVADPFIGKLNNVRVRKALYAGIDSFLTSCVQDEALIAYKLDVTATRDDEIAGKAVVKAVIQPTFSIDYIVVTLVLE